MNLCQQLKTKSPKKIQPKLKEENRTNRLEENETFVVNLNKTGLKNCFNFLSANLLAHTMCVLRNATMTFFPPEW